MLNNLKIDDLVKVTESSPYVKKGTIGYINEIFEDGTASISKVDSENEVFIALDSLRKIN